MSKKHLLKTLAKKANQTNTNTIQDTDVASASSEDTSLLKQYDIIKNDIVKLRDDLSKGYDMAKQAITKKGALTELLRG